MKFNPQTGEKVEYPNCGNLDGEAGEYWPGDGGHTFVVTNTAEKVGPAHLNELLDPATCSFRYITQLSDVGEVTAAGINNDHHFEYWVEGSGLWSYNLIDGSKVQLTQSDVNVEGIAHHNNERFVVRHHTFYRLDIAHGRAQFTQLYDKLPGEESEAMDEMHDGTIAVSSDKTQRMLAFNTDGTVAWEILIPFEDLETLWWVPES